MDATHAAADGRHDFDFLFGRWRIHNRKLVDTHDHSCTEWVEFEATSEAWPMLGGLGNVDRYSVAAMPPGGQPFEGMTVRLYVPETRRWRIWWASTRFPGELDTPLEGGFEWRSRRVPLRRSGERRAGQGPVRLAGALDDGDPVGAVVLL